MTAMSYDPHTNYLSPDNAENFDINMSLSLEGIGAVLQSDNDQVKVVRLVPAGPADKTKQVAPADKIIGVAQGNKEMVDVVGWRLDEVVKLIRKLRWMGMDEEAKVLENQLALDGFPVADCVIGVSRETD